MPLFLERTYPWIGSVVATAVYILWFRDNAVPEQINDLFSAAITVSAIGVGMFATAKAIVVQPADTRPLIEKLKQAERYDVFLRYLSLAINISFVVAALSAIYLLVDFKERDTWHQVAFGAWLAAGVLGALSYFRVIRVLSVVFDRS